MPAYGILQHVLCVHIGFRWWIDMLSHLTYICISTFLHVNGDDGDIEMSLQNGCMRVRVTTARARKYTTAR